MKLNEKMYQEDKEVKWIYEHLADDLSKKIFILRYMYYLTNDDTFFRELVLTRGEILEVYKELKSSNKKKIIFGAGDWGRAIQQAFCDIEFECFVDNKKEEKNMFEFVGKKVISFEEYLNIYRDEMIIISSRVYNQEMEEQLISNGVSRENIVNLGAINDELNLKQYFDLPELMQNCVKREIFVDAGCLDGRSSICFKEWAGERFGKVYAFEPDERNIELVKKNFSKENIQEFEIISKGLWNKSATLSFSAKGNGTSSITSAGDTEIVVDKLDDMVDEAVSFVKMDIEGAEYKALLGCEKVIKGNMPKLAISVYHKAEDIIAIPSLILKYEPNYKLYLRHYSTTSSETILYAIK